MKGKAIWAMVAGFIALMVLVGCAPTVPLEDYQAFQESFEAQANELADVNAKLIEVQTDREDAIAAYDSINAELEALKAQSSENEAKLAELEAFKTEIETAQAEEVKVAEAVAKAEWYVIDDLALGVGVGLTTLDNGDLSFLLDDEFEFADNDYDYQEKIELNFLQVTTSLNGDDEFGDELALTFEDEYSVVYGFFFDDVVDYTTITEDDALVISMLGTQYVIIDASATSFTYLQGTDFVVKEDETFAFGEHAITIGLVTEDEVAVTVDGIVKFIDEKDSEEFDGVTVRATDIYYTGKDTQKSVVTLTVSDNDAEVTVDNGDEFIEDDSRFEWLIQTTGNDLEFIGIGLVEKADDADEEVLQPLMAGETFDFAGLFSLYFDYNDNYDYLKYTVDFKEIQVGGTDIDTVRISGEDKSIVVGDEELDVVYFDGTNAYYKDDHNDWVTDGINPILLENDDLAYVVSYAGNVLTIGELELDLQSGFTFFGLEEEDAEATDLVVGGNNLGGRDDDVLLESGVIVRNVESNLDNDEVVFELPNEVVEALVKVGRP